MDKKQIYKTLDEMKNRNFKHIDTLTDRVSVFEYESLAEEKNGIKIWTKAFQKAIDKLLTSMNLFLFRFNGIKVIYMFTNGTGKNNCMNV